uniref:Superoxide dismutase [Cu-Zn] n=1 Tax=Ixodes ricinus TaxID=34613 RepID=A0A0K8RL33_IXORI
MAASPVLAILLSFCGCLFWALGAHAQSVICVLNAGEIRGIVQFAQLNASHVRVSFNGSGIPHGVHGFHVHQYGDISTGCAAAGGHFNPDSVNHGGPDAPVRHVGDLGNVEADRHGVVTFIRDDSYLQLSGDRSILGRAVVLHADPDDLGLGGSPDSLTTGHAGARIACCVIVYAK